MTIDSNTNINEPSNRNPDYKLIVTIDEVHSSIELHNPKNIQLYESLHKIMHTELGIKDPDAFHNSAFKRGYWDGIKDFYDMKTDTFPTGLLHQALTALRQLQDSDSRIYFDIEDERDELLLHPDDMDEEIEVYNKGEVVTLRDYQYETVQEILKEKIGIVNISTGGGKTKTAAGAIQQLLHHLPQGKRVAFFVSSQDLFYQSYDEIVDALGIDERYIGVLGDGKDTITNMSRIVFIMVKTFHSRLQDPSNDIKYTPKDKTLKYIAEVVSPKFATSANAKTLLKGYVHNTVFKTKYEQEAEKILAHWAYEPSISKAQVKLNLNKVIVDLDKLKERKAGKKHKIYKRFQDIRDSIYFAIVDEAHEASGNTYQEVLLQLNSPYRIGLTGTVDKTKLLHWQKLQSVFGNVISRTRNEEIINMGYASKPYFKIVPIKSPTDIEFEKDWHTIYRKGIVENEQRNNYIAKICHSSLEQEGNILISVIRIEHGNTLKDKIRELGLSEEHTIEFLHGQLDGDERKDIMARFKQGDIKILIASTVLDQGIDVNNLRTLITCSGTKSMRAILQRIGRGLRTNDYGNKVTVWDFIDYTHKHLLKHSKDRLSIYKDEKFDVTILGKNKKKNT